MSGGAEGVRGQTTKLNIRTNTVSSIMDCSVQTGWTMAAFFFFFRVRYDGCVD